MCNPRSRLIYYALRRRGPAVHPNSSSFCRQCQRRLSRRAASTSSPHSRSARDAPCPPQLCESPNSPLRAPRMSLHSLGRLRGGGRHLRRDGRLALHRSRVACRRRGAARAPGAEVVRDGARLLAERQRGAAQPHELRKEERTALGDEEERSSAESNRAHKKRRVLMLHPETATHKTPHADCSSISDKPASPSVHQFARSDGRPSPGPPPCSRGCRGGGGAVRGGPPRRRGR